MKITVDTNILVRAVVRDDEKQAEAAAKLLKEAEVIRRIVAGVRPVIPFAVPLIAQQGQRALCWSEDGGGTAGFTLAWVRSARCRRPAVPGQSGPRRHMGPEIADHRLLDRADIGQDGTLPQRIGCLTMCISEPIGAAMLSAWPNQMPALSDPGV
jgi:hypothetical protein